MSTEDTAQFPTPRTDSIDKQAQQIILHHEFGSSTADIISQIVELYSKHARSLETFNIGTCKRGDELQAKVNEKDKEIARLTEFCQEFVWGEENPAAYKTLLARAESAEWELPKERRMRKTMETRHGEVVAENAKLRAEVEKLNYIGTVAAFKEQESKLVAIHDQLRNRGFEAEQMAREIAKLRAALQEAHGNKERLIEALNSADAELKRQAAVWRSEPTVTNAFPISCIDTERKRIRAAIDAARKSAP